MSPEAPDLPESPQCMCVGVVGERRKVVRFKLRTE